MWVTSLDDNFLRLFSALPVFGVSKAKGIDSSEPLRALQDYEKDTDENEFKF